jgi:hypothetical protein
MITDETTETTTDINDMDDKIAVYHFVGERDDSPVICENDDIDFVEEKREPLQLTIQIPDDDKEIYETRESPTEINEILLGEPTEINEILLGESTEINEILLGEPTEINETLLGEPTEIRESINEIILGEPTEEENGLLEPEE